MSNRRCGLGQCVLVLTISGLLSACVRIDPAEEMQKARIEVQNENLAAALIHLSNVLQAQPSDPDARALRGRIALLQGDLDLAEDELRRAIELGSTDDSVAVWLADVLVQSGRPQEALDLLAGRSGLEQDASYWTIRAEADAVAGRAEAAQPAADRARELAGETTRLLLLEARLAALREDDQRVDDLLTRAVTAARSSSEVGQARAARGLYHIRGGRLDLAAPDFEVAAEVFTATGSLRRAAAALTALVQIHLARNELDTAARVAQRLVAVAPGSLSAAYVDGLIAYERGEFGVATGHLQRAVSAAPDNPMLRTLLGAAYLSRGDVYQAEAELQRALRLAPNDPAARKLLAEARLRQRRPEAALEALRPLAGLGTDPQVSALLGVASLEVGDSEQGIALLEEAVGNDPDNQALRLHLARAYLAARRADAAAQLLAESPVIGEDEFQVEVLLLLSLLRDGEADCARQRAEELAAESPPSAPALATAAIYYQLTGDTARALSLLERAVSVDAAFLPARLVMAGFLAQAGRISEAERQLQAVVEIEPGHTVALAGLAQAARIQGNLDEAKALLRRALEAAPQAHLHLALARILIEQGDLDGARAEADAAARLSPEDPEVVFGRGLVALAATNWSEAVGLLSTAAERLPRRPDVALALAQAHAGADDLAAARATLSAFLERMPASLPVLAALGAVELRAGNGDAAFQIAKSLQVDYPQRATGYLLEADVRMAQRRYDEAAASYELAFEREPSWVSLTALVSALNLAERVEEAGRVVQRWLEQRSDDVRARLLLASIMETAGRQRDALAEYEHVLSLGAADVVALNNAAWLRHELGDARALELARAAHELAPDNPAVLDTLGWILVSRGLHEEALTHLEAAAAKAPNAPDIQYHLAYVYAETGKTAAAREILAALLDRYAEFSTRADAEALLARL